MNRAILRRELDIQAPVERVWQFIGTQEGLRQWWGGEISMEAKQGGRCAEEINMHGEIRYLTGVVTVYEPPHRLTLVLQPQRNPGDWPEVTTISITLHQEAEQTKVTLVHEAVAPESLNAVSSTRLPVRPSTIPNPQMSVAFGPRRAIQGGDARPSAEPLHQVGTAQVKDQTLWIQRLDALHAAVLA